METSGAPSGNKWVGSLPCALFDDLPGWDETRYNAVHNPHFASVGKDLDLLLFTPEQSVSVVLVFL